MPAMPFSPDPDDVTVGILGHIFGPIIDVLVKGQDPNTVSAASNLLATLFTFFNSGILVVGSIIIGYVAVMGAVNTANDGEAMGKAWSTVWTPVRIVAGGSVLLPSASGYSFMQMMVLTISLWSIGFANGIYKLGMGMGVLKPDGIVATSYQTGTYFGLRDFGKQYLAAAYCARAANTIYSDAAGNPSVMANSTADKQATTGTRTDYTFFIKDRNAATNLGGGEPICGTVTLTTYAPSGTYSDTSGTQAALDNLRAALMAQKATAATGLMQDIDNWVATMPSDIGQPGWDSVQSSQFNSIVKNREDQVVAAIANQITASEGDVNGGVNAFISDMTKGGWALAGGWYQRAGLLRSKLSTITSESVGNVSSPSLSGLPDDARSKLLSNSVTTVAEAVGKKAELAGNGYDGSVMPKPEDMATLLPKDANSDVNVGALDNDMSTKTTLFVNSLMKQSVDLAIGSGSNVDAVARMKMTGDLLSSYQAMLWAAEFTIKTSITGLRVVANGFGVTKLAGVSLDGMANALWDWALQVPIPVIAKLAEYTGFLGYYFGVALPSLPYTVFMITVVGWILGVVQTTIAAPLWAIMHMRPSQTFVGSESQGYLLLLALFVRPALAVIGLFAAFLIADPVTDFTAKAFFAMRGDVAASTDWVGVLAQFTQFFWWFVAFGSLLGVVLFMIFGLSQSLPDQVLAWLNVGVHDLGATSAANEMRAGIGRQGQQAGRESVERLANTGGGRGSRGQLPGDGTSGGPNGNGPRGGGGGSTPLNAGGQGVAPPLDPAEPTVAQHSAAPGRSRSSAAATSTGHEAGLVDSRPLSGGDTPPTSQQTEPTPRRPLKERISDAVGVASGQAVLSAVDAVRSSGKRAAEAFRQAEGPVGGIVGGYAAAMVGLGEGLSHAPGAIAREGVAAFMEGADARIAALNADMQPVNTGDQQATTRED